ncbi:MAG: single-stranded-DNA-specific exonuclease RecJ [Deltaproteobacteria bacterium]|nr:single-stranded-DNA-specific exonuclease RecJ [Deltaproteobacteria bacterium]
MDNSIEIDKNKSITFRHLKTTSAVNQKLLEQLKQELNLSELVAQILIERGINSLETAKFFLTPSFQNGFENPNQIKNINLLAEELLKFTKAKTPITIFCDFDVDGLTAGAQAYLYLHELGANVGYYVPNRFEDGYGLSLKAVKKIANSGAKVLVTIDCGISNFEEIAYAKSLGLTCFVLDHHQVLTPPPADIIVDPEQDDCPFKPFKLCAAGLIWMLLIVLRQKATVLLEQTTQTLPDPKNYIELAALGTVCDMVPLLNLNRLIVYRGLEALKQTKRVGLLALMELTNLVNNPRLNAGSIGFCLGPRINAVGRIGHAANVFELLITKDQTLAKKLAKTINNCNEERKNIEQDSLQKCLNYLKQYPELLENPALAIFNKEFHLGIMGIIAGRLVEQFNVPVAIMSMQEIFDSNGDKRKIIKGSVRGVTWFNVVQALKNISHLCLNCGGHDQAGGFSIEFEKLAEFQAAFIKQAFALLDPSQLKKKYYTCDVEIGFKQLNFKTVNELSKLAPFGVGNPPLLFLTRNVVIQSIITLQNKGYKLLFKDIQGGEFYLYGIIWGAVNKEILEVGKTVNILFSPEINNFGGNSTVQLTLKEIF